MCAHHKMDSDYIQYLNALVPPLRKTKGLATERDIEHRLYYRENHKQIRMRKLLADIAFKGRVPNTKTLHELECNKEDIIRCWLAFRSTGKRVSETKARRMRVLISSWL